MLPADGSGLERAADRLQPALLDRLVDDAPQQPRDAADGRIVGPAQLRRAVLRDLGWLLNATCLLDDAHRRRYPWLAQSVLNFGLPPLAGQLASRIDVPLMERTLRQVLLSFEPRLVEETLTVRALEAASVLETHNIIEFEIRGHLWAQPVPLELLLRTRMDLEAGQIEVRESTRSALPPGRP
ncbi:type VI secretion system baseplate subunit TssE [Sphaerotilus uruguayifluvii]|nr:type VI secretion system baseplate subunit TssE [Leptothrix sp. C29]